MILSSQEAANCSWHNFRELYDRNRLIFFNIDTFHDSKVTLSVFNLHITFHKVHGVTGSSKQLFIESVSMTDQTFLQKKKTSYRNILMTNWVNFKLMPNILLRLHFKNKLEKVKSTRLIFLQHQFPLNGVRTFVKLDGNPTIVQTGNKGLVYFL